MAGTRTRRIGLAVGLALAIGLQLLPRPDGLSAEAWMLASLALMMASWWATEAIPIAATALVPLALFPLFGIVSPGAAAAPYASTTVMLLLGGFIVAMAFDIFIENNPHHIDMRLYDNLVLIALNIDALAKLTQRFAKMLHQAQHGIHGNGRQKG